MHFCTNTPHELTLFTVDKVVTKTTAGSYCQVFAAFNWMEFVLSTKHIFPKLKTNIRENPTPPPHLVPTSAPRLKTHSSLRRSLGGKQWFHSVPRLQGRRTASWDRRGLCGCVDRGQQVEGQYACVWSGWYRG